jgi:hypothetical protein
MLRWVYERLGTSPAQETVLADAAEAVASAAQSFRGEWAQSRADLARALQAAQAGRSARKEGGGVRVQLDPAELI